MQKTTLTPEQFKFLSLLSEKHPTTQSLYTEISNMQATLGLPKGTEHYLSDLHGEFEAFEHILNNCSGVIREKIRFLFGSELNEEETNTLCTVIYYPKQKLKLLENSIDELWYRRTLSRLITLAGHLSSKYTRAKVRQAIPPAYAFILDELLHAKEDEDQNQLLYHQGIMDTLFEIHAEQEFIIAICCLIKHLAVDRLFILGDVFDRGGKPDLILDLLYRHPSVEFTWGNHDALWMGAACGSTVCIAGAVRNTLQYHHNDLLEVGYGISLKPLYSLASRLYPALSPDEAALKTITIIMFKLEGQTLRRHPEYEMDDRLFLDRIDTEQLCITLNGKTWPLIHQSFPTLKGNDYYLLTEGEEEVVFQLSNAFEKSEKLHTHVRFLYDCGGMYSCHDGNLLFHGCIPLNPDGSLRSATFEDESYSGRSLMDFCDQKARTAYSKRRQNDVDFMWFLWCGDFSPLCGRKMGTFAHLMIADKAAWSEPRDPYYTYNKTEEGCEMLLKAFGLHEKSGRIINGHTPVLKGESPLRAGGRSIVIDGGFCKAYQPKTGIAGYTLISNSHGMRIVAHQPFIGLSEAVRLNTDIVSTQTESLPFQKRLMIRDTDAGRQIAQRIEDLKQLLACYRSGLLHAKYTDNDTRDDSAC